MKIDIVPYTLYSNIYIVGDATPNGWDIGNATDMEKIGTNLHRFTWTGNLRAGEIKFSCDKKIRLEWGMVYRNKCKLTANW